VLLPLLLRLLLPLLLQPLLLMVTVL